MVRPPDYKIFEVTMPEIFTIKASENRVCDKKRCLWTHFS